MTSEAMATEATEPTEATEATARVAEAAALDAYSRIVVDISERLAPSVANLRVTRPSRSGGHVLAVGLSVV
jgi:hypothetical protein